MSTQELITMAKVEGVSLAWHGGKLKVESNSVNPPTTELLGLLKENKSKLAKVLKPDLPRDMWRLGLTYPQAMQYQREQRDTYRCNIGACAGAFFVAAPGSGLNDVRVPYDESKASEEPTDVERGYYPASSGIDTADATGRELEHYEVHVGRARGKVSLLYPEGTVAQYRRQLFDMWTQEKDTLARDFALALVGKVDSGLGVVFTHDGADEKDYAEQAAKFLRWAMGV